MKPVKNTLIKPVKEIQPTRLHEYWCASCGTPDEGIVHYHEVTYGTASLEDIDGSLTNYEIQDSDHFEIDYYMCNHCAVSDEILGDLFTTEDPHREDDEDDPD